MTPSPWLYLSEHWPEVKIHLRMLAGGDWGRTVWTETGPVVYLRATLGPIAQRCTLWHEIGHLELGPPPVDEDPENEADVVRWTARRLLPDIATVGRLLTEHDVDQAARLLQVTRRVLIDRLQALDEQERADLEVVMAKAVVAGLSATENDNDPLYDGPAQGA